MICYGLKISELQAHLFKEIHSDDLEAPDLQKNGQTVTQFVMQSPRRSARGNAFVLRLSNRTKMTRH